MRTRVNDEKVRNASLIYQLIRGGRPCHDRSWDLALGIRQHLSHIGAQLRQFSEHDQHLPSENVMLHWVC